MDKIGKRVQYFREQAGLKKIELARKVGIDPSQITKIENNTSKPALETLFNICNALNVSVAEFFSYTEVPLSKEQRELLKQSETLNKEQIELLSKLLKSFDK